MLPCPEIATPAQAQEMFELFPQLPTQNILDVTVNGTVLWRDRIYAGTHDPVDDVPACVVSYFGATDGAAVFDVDIKYLPQQVKTPDPTQPFYGQVGFKYLGGNTETPTTLVFRVTRPNSADELSIERHIVSPITREAIKHQIDTSKTDRTLPVFGGGPQDTEYDHLFGDLLGAVREDLYYWHANKVSSEAQARSLGLLAVSFSDAQGVIGYLRKARVTRRRG